MLEDRRLDKESPVPLYFQLKQVILDEIQKKHYPIGSMLPTEKELIEMYGISRTTVRQAITDLVKEGHLHRINGKGTFVTRPKINQSFLTMLQSFYDDVNRVGGVPCSQVLEVGSIVIPKEVADATELPDDTEAVFLHRKFLADGQPIMTVRTYLFGPYVKGIMDIDLKNFCLYDELAKNPNSEIYKIKRSCEARLADNGDVLLLNVKKGSPILHMVSRGYNQRDELIEYSISRHRGDSSMFQIEVSNDPLQGKIN